MNFATIKGAAMTAGRFVVKHKGLFLSGAATIGVLATAYFAYKESDEVKERLAKAEVEKGEKLTKIETVKTAAPAMKKTLFATGMTIAVIWGSRFLDEKDKKKLRENIREIREDFRAFRELNDAVNGEGASDKTIQEMANASNDTPLAMDDTRVYKIWDTNNKFEFKATIPQVKSAWAAMNEEFIKKGRTTFATFYKHLNTPAPLGADEIGWDQCKLPKKYYELYGRDFLWIDFELKNTPSKWSDYDYEMNCVDGPFFMVDRQPGHHWRNNGN